MLSINFFRLEILKKYQLEDIDRIYKVVEMLRSKKKSV